MPPILNKGDFMGRGSSKAGSKSARSSRTGYNTIEEKRKRIQELKDENERIIKREYAGRKNWGQQLDADVKKVSKNNREIEKLEEQIKKIENGGTKKKQETKKTEKSPIKWQRAGQGWYVGQNGLEIRQNYDDGGFDVVKVTSTGGEVTKKLKHFSNLKDARNFKG